MIVGFTDKNVAFHDDAPHPPPVPRPSDQCLSLSVRQSGGGSPQSQRPAELSDDEVGELFQRLAEVQQEKWMLEEKVRTPP